MYRSICAMNTARLEAFTDGVIAIIITIMVLEIHVPKGHDLAALKEEVPLLLAYVLSYVNVGIFWNNHHHMLHVTERVDGRVLWANLALLFWLSLVPFVIRWIDEAGLHHSAGGRLRRRADRRLDRLPDPRADDHRRERTGLAASRRPSVRTSRASCRWRCTCWRFALAFLEPWISIALYVAVALMWLIPDRRIEALHFLRKSSTRSAKRAEGRPQQAHAAHGRLVETRAQPLHAGQGDPRARHDGTCLRAAGSCALT